MYLIVKFEPLNDQYECDAYREPICLTHDITDWKYNEDYEIYKVLDDGSLHLVQQYGEWLV